MVYDKKKRHQIYKDMLRALPLTKTAHGNYSLCYTLMRVLNFSGSLYDFKIPKVFEELKMFRPKDRSTSQDYWFEGHDLESRELVLEFCIEMTKE